MRFVVNRIKIIADKKPVRPSKISSEDQPIECWITNPISDNVNETNSLRTLESKSTMGDLGLTGILIPEICNLDNPVIAAVIPTSTGNSDIEITDKKTFFPDQPTASGTWFSSIFKLNQS